MNNRRLEELQLDFNQQNARLKLLNTRIGGTSLPRYYPDSVDGSEHMAHRLKSRGGFPQQLRMIKDKRHALDQATKYSYQAALVKKYFDEAEPLMEGEREALPARALINPNKLKQDYDDKIISIGFEHNFKTGDIFEWCNTGTYWLIYLQDLDELAYFRGDIRKCTYQISWKDEDGNVQKTYAAIRGPVETAINYIQKHGISVDNPNYSLNILMPKNTYTLNYFKRYTKFYLPDADVPDNKICWRVTATDSISTPGILEVAAQEYYANEDEDDVENGIAGGLIVEPIDPNKNSVQEYSIIGETFIKPKKEYEYSIDSSLYGDWYVSDIKLPIKIIKQYDEYGILIVNKIKLKWNQSFSGQFDLWFGDDNGPLNDYKKTIIVESLF